MKRFLTLVIMTLMLATVSAFSAEAAGKKKSDKNIAEATFVATIDCKNCVKKVEANLPFVEGIKDMKVTLADKTIWVKYDTRKTDPEKIAAAIGKIGFKAELKNPVPAK